MDPAGLAALLTKAVGDITALLLAAGKANRVADFTSGYVAAVNAYDAQAQRPIDLVERMARSFEPALWSQLDDPNWFMPDHKPDQDLKAQSLGRAGRAVAAYQAYWASDEVVQADRQLLAGIAACIEWGPGPECDLKIIADFRRAAAGRDREILLAVLAAQKVQPYSGWNITELNKAVDLAREHLGMPSIRDLNPDIPAPQPDPRDAEDAKSFMRKLIQNQGNGVWWANAIREYLARTGETAADPKVSG